MTTNDQHAEAHWLQVIARCLCYLCLQQAQLKDAKILDKAKLLASFGLARAQCAGILGTTDGSLRQLEHLSRKRKGAKGGGRKKKQSVK